MKIITFCVPTCLLTNVTVAAVVSRRGEGHERIAAIPQGVSAEQLDNLLAPIALYPDPLLAQVFPLRPSSIKSNKLHGGYAATITGAPA